MSTERALLTSLLKLTKNGPAERESISMDAKIPPVVASKLLRALQNDGLVNLDGSIVKADTASRLELAIKAMNTGADVEYISDYLCWQEFEEMAKLALNMNGYATKKNVRFKHVNKRWEIDVVGCRKPLVVCIDCKHWHHGMHQSTLRRAIKAQVERVEAFAQSLPAPSIEVECIRWEKAKFIPIILSLIPGNFKFIEDVPIVPVLQFQDFINQLPTQIYSIRHFDRCFSHL